MQVAFSPCTERIQTTQSVRPCDYAKGAVTIVAIIEMETDCKHFLKDADRRLDKYLALLL
jgi:hypothetical protein